MKRALLVVAVAALVLTAGAAARPDAAPLRILFVGNSLTASNDLPATVAAIGRGNGLAIEVGAVAPGGFSLENNRNAGARDVLARGDWDVLVMQQGPVNPLREPAAPRALGTPLRGRGACARNAACGLGIWPDGGDSYSFRAVIESYRLAAKSAGATFLPAGTAWRAALRQNRRLPLYGPDVFHPAPFGTYLAAVTVVRGLGLRPARLPRSLVVGGVPVRLTAARVRLLEAAVAEALASRR